MHHTIKQKPASNIQRAFSHQEKHFTWLKVKQKHVNDNIVFLLIISGKWTLHTVNVYVYNYTSTRFHLQVKYKCEEWEWEWEEEGAGVFSQSLA